jgi:hypothetical protein
MYDIFIALVFIAMVLSPVIVATIQKNKSQDDA